MNGTATQPEKKVCYENLLFLTVLTFLIGSRWYGLGQWPVEDDEIFTYSRAMTGAYSWHFPALYWLTSLSFKLFGPSELSLRLPCFIFGIAALPALYFLAKRIFDRRTALLAGILLAVSPYHLYHSQYGRYYSAIFLLAILTYSALYIYFTKNSLAALCCTLVLFACGTLFHPTFLLIGVSSFLFSIFINITAVANSRLFDWPVRTRTAARTFTILAIVVGLVCLVYAAIIFNKWSEFSCQEGGGWGYSFFWFLAQTCKYFGFAVCGLAFFGLLHLFTRNIFNALFLQFLIATPVLIATAISGIVDVRPDYIIIVYPLCLLLTSWLLQEMWKQQRILLPALGIVVAIIMSIFPEFLSVYSGRASLDPRQAVNYIEKRYQSGDAVVSFSSGFSFYGKKYFPSLVWIGCSYEPRTLQKLKDDFAHTKVRTWFVLQTSRSGGDQAVRTWLDHNARLEKEILEKRYDYTYRGLRIYLKAGDSDKWPVEPMIGKIKHGEISR